MPSPTHTLHGCHLQRAHGRAANVVSQVGVTTFVALFLQPVCTTEIGRLALKYKDLESKGVKLATLSCDPVTSHQKWLEDVVAHCENKASGCVVLARLPLLTQQECMSVACPD